MATAEIEIRGLRLADELDIHAAYEEAVEEGGSFPTEPPVSLADTRAVWIDDNDRVLVAELDGLFAGCCYVRPNYGGRGSSIANAGYLVPRWARGRGIGRALLDRSLDEARQLHYAAMVFNLVFERNPARRLWERAGFREIGRIPRAIDAEQDALIYFREL
jgi:L-amino acid N-acyltransferase YncA